MMEWGGVVSDLLEVIEHIRGSPDGFELRSFGSLLLATHDKHSDGTEAYALLHYCTIALMHYCSLHNNPLR